MIELIQTEEEAIKLTKQLMAYSRRYTGAELDFINIVNAFNKLAPHGNHGSRLFAALIDLKFNFTLLLIDSFNSGAIWNAQNAISFSEEKDILENYELFEKRFDIHKHDANYIPRYRAIWDKIMGILLLFASEEVYEKYNSSKSRKKAFRTLSKNVEFLTDEFVENVLKHMQDFDDSFRTGEMHRFGSLRKYSFLKSPHDKREYILLKNSWNYLLGILTEIDRLIADIKDETL